MNDVHQVFKKDQTFFLKIGGLDYHHSLALLFGANFHHLPKIFKK
jgi:hypothetical protein